MPLVALVFFVIIVLYFRFRYLRLLTSTPTSS